MYKGYQEELFKNTWGVNSGFKHLVDQLNELLPLQGKVENSRSTNKNLDKFRRMQNAAYDLFNNGLGNKRDLFVREFGEAPTQKSVYYFNKLSWQNWEDRVEKMLTPVIIAAAKEQGVK